MRIAVAAAALLLAGCAHHEKEPVVRTVPVNKPVAVQCVPGTLESTPDYPDTDDALRNAVDAAERYRLVAAGRLMRDARLSEIESVVQTCKRSEVVK